MVATPRCGAAETATAKPTCDGTYVTAQGNKWFSVSMTRASGCPANSYQSASSTDVCQCETGFQSKNNQCVVECKADTRTSTGWYDVGTDSSKSPPLVACRDSCRVVFMGYAPEESVVRDGVK